MKKYEVEFDGNELFKVNGFIIFWPGSDDYLVYTEKGYEFMGDIDGKGNYDYIGEYFENFVEAFKYCIKSKQI